MTLRVRNGLPAGGRWIRTLGSARDRLWFRRLRPFLRRLWKSRRKGPITERDAPSCDQELKVRIHLPPAESPFRTQKAGVLHSDFCEFIAWWVSVGPPPHISSSSRGSGTPITLATSRLISVAWDDWEYGHGAVGCGAAHPNSHAKVETLMLSPVPHSMQPSDLFRQRRYGPNKVAP